MKGSVERKPLSRKLWRETKEEITDGFGSESPRWNLVFDGPVPLLQHAKRVPRPFCTVGAGPPVTV